MKREVRVYNDYESMSEAAAQGFSHLTTASVRDRGRCIVALSGGRTPRRFYRLLSDEYSDAVPWRDMYILLTDERYVPFDHPASNFGMISELLFSRIDISPERIHRIPVDTASTEEAAAAYENTLQSIIAEGGDSSEPLLDLAVLGCGIDGHTASLFPGSPAIGECERFVTRVEAPDAVDPKSRVTVTLPLLNRSGALFFLVSGEEKRRVVGEILDGSEEEHREYPAAMVRPIGLVRWYIDRDAAGVLIDNK